MKAQDLTIDVNAALTVSDVMADRCLRLLEMWQADHPDQRLMSSEDANGAYKLYREYRPYKIVLQCSECQRNPLTVKVK